MVTWIILVTIHQNAFKDMIIYSTNLQRKIHKVKYYAKEYKKYYILAFL